MGTFVKMPTTSFAAISPATAGGELFVAEGAAGMIAVVDRDAAAKDGAVVDHTPSGATAFLADPARYAPDATGRGSALRAPLFAEAGNFAAPARSAEKQSARPDGESKTPPANADAPIAGSNKDLEYLVGRLRRFSSDGAAGGARLSEKRCVEHGPAGTLLDDER